MIYVFDTSSFIVVGHYFPEQFPSFWEHFDAAVSAQQILSVREVFRELDNESCRTHLRDWIARNKNAFATPTTPEAEFVASIFAVDHFRQLVTQKQRLKGTPVADPFVIAAAAIRNGCVVTEEMPKENAAKIPNVCEHFSVEWTSLEGFMAAEKWRF